MFRAATILFSGNIVLAVANLLRAVLVARLLTLEDFGIAATFNIAMNAITMAFGFSLGQMVIQASDGNAPRVRAALHLLQLLMGLTLFTGFFLMAGPFSALMGLPDLGWAYRMLAVLALFLGLVHFDIFVQQRARRVLGVALYNTGPVVVSLLAIWPLFVLFGDWRIMPFALLIQGAATLIISHLRSDQPYRLNYDGAVFRRALAFGAPLFGNAIVLFILFSGDRIIVSNRFGAEGLAWFSAAFMLTLMPVNLVVKSLQNLLLPWLARASDADSGRDRAAILTCRIFALTGAGIAGVFALGGDGLLLLAFGPEYVGAGQILVLLGVMQGVRCMRAAPDLLALSRGRTRIIFQTSLLRAMFIPLGAAAVFWLDLPLTSLILIGLVAEGVTMAYAFHLLARGTAISLAALAPSLALPGLCLLMILALSWLTQPARSAPWLPLNLWALIPLMLLVPPLAKILGPRPWTRRPVLPNLGVRSC